MSQRYDYLYSFTSSDLIEFLDDSELTDGMSRDSMLEIAIDQMKDEECQELDLEIKWK